MEVLGHVEAAGAGAEAWLGKRVVAVPSGAFGGYAELAVGPSAMAFEMPPEWELPDAAAAAVYLPFHLSWLALYERARVRAGETVLIHAAAGGVGSAAIQLAVLAGARVIATAGSAEKVEFCMSLGADVAMNYLDNDFVDVVLDATNGRGVDVAFDSVGGEVTSKTFPMHGVQRPSPLGWIRVRASRPRISGSCRGRCSSGTSRCSECVSPTWTIPCSQGRSRVTIFPRGPTEYVSMKASSTSFPMVV